MGNSDDQAPPGDSTTNSLQLFMNGGACKESWKAYQDCTEKNKNEKTFDSGCFSMLEKCMKANPEYYQPVLAADKTGLEQFGKDCIASFIPSAVGKDLMECIKDGDAEVGKELVRFDRYLEEGGCKESFTAHLDCWKEAEKNKEDSDTKCHQLWSTVVKCVNSNYDYYHPIVALLDSSEEQLWRDLEKSL